MSIDKPKSSTRRLNEIALRHPGIYAELVRNAHGEISIEEALINCIERLVDENDKLRSEIIRVFSENPSRNGWF